MTTFEDLPAEIVPLIVEHIPQPWQLARVAAVSRIFNAFTTERLYHTIYIYAWHKNAKAKVCLRLINFMLRLTALRPQVMSLIRTLAEYPHLAAYVRSLSEFAPI